MAMAIKAQGGTGREKETQTKRRWKTVSRVKFRNKHISLTAKPFSIHASQKYLKSFVYFPN